MSADRSLAIFGAAPLFDAPVAKGQRFFPSWPEYEEIFRDIFERQYYTNHGPLAKQLEQQLAERLGTRHAMCVTNDFIGLALTGQALGIRGNVVVPGHARIATALSLDWTDARPLFCDVDATTGAMSAELVAPLLAEHPVSAILAVNPWGDACDVEGLQALAERHRIPLYFDSAHAFGCTIDGRPIGSFGTAEVISFHSDNIIGATEGGVICTQMDDLAARIRNMRSNYGMGPPVRVAKTGNGRMSEAQAAIALFNLSRYAEHRHRNERLFGLYRDGLGAIPGIKVRVPSGVTESNYQNCICTVDQAAFGLDRDTLCEVLRAENLDVGKGLGPIFAGSQRLAAPHLPNLPNARQFFERIIELPMNEALEDTDAVRIVARIGSIQKDAAAILERLSELA